MLDKNRLVEELRLYRFLKGEIAGEIQFADDERQAIRELRTPAVLDVSLAATNLEWLKAHEARLAQRETDKQSYQHTLDGVYTRIAQLLAGIPYTWTIVVPIEVDGVTATLQRREHEMWHITFEPLPKPKED